MLFVMFAENRFYQSKDKAYLTINYVYYDKMVSHIE